MLRLVLSSVIGAHEATAALRNGEVTPRGFELAFAEVESLPGAFRSMVRDLAFDVCEMSIATYLCAREHGNGFTALPIFPARNFHHAAAVVAADSRVTPRDLEGGRVGVERGYTVTTGVWARGVLASEHGVDLSSVTWQPTADEHVVEFVPPPNVQSLRRGADLAALLADGTLAAAVGIRSGRGVKPLIPDPADAALTALIDRGHYPINHLIVVRDELLEAHPELPASLFEAFVASKRRYLRGTLAPQDRRVAEVLGDPLPYGVERSRGAVHELLDHLVAQRIIGRRPSLEQIFAPGTLELEG